jgi:type II secretory pathway component GspD/PulD (secretin)
MRARQTLCAALLPLLAVALAGTARADESLADKRVAIAVQDMPLSDVAKLLSRQTGAQVAVHPGVAGHRVSLRLDGVPLASALTLVAEVADAEVGQTDTGYLLRRPSDPVQGKYVPLTEPVHTAPLPKRDRLTKAKVACQHVAPSEIAAYFGSMGVKAGPDGLVTTMPGPQPVALTHTTLVRRDGEDAVLKLHRDELVEAIEDRFEVRWHATPAHAAGTPHRYSQAGRAGASLRIPDGVRAVLGFDPSKTLVIAGEAEAVARFQEMAKTLDTPPANIALQARYYLVPVGAVDGLGLPWTLTNADSGRALLRYATAPQATAEAALARTGGIAFDTSVASVKNVQPAVLSFTRWLSSQAPAEPGIDLATALAPDAKAVMATTDVKVVTWLSGGQLNVHVDPAFGDVVVDTADGADWGAATLSTATPALSAALTAKPGESIVLGGLVPVRNYRAPGAGRLLSTLPLIGELYRVDKQPLDSKAVVIVLTPSVVPAR